jgi:WD40 repeat protein
MLRKLEGHSKPVLSIAFSPDGKTLISSGGHPRDPHTKPDTCFRFWDVASGKETYYSGARAGVVSSFAISPKGNRFAFSSNGCLRCWEMDSKRELWSQDRPGEYTGNVVFSSSGNLIAAAVDVTKVALCDPNNGRFIRYIVDQDCGFVCLAFSPDETTLVTGDWDGALQLWEVSTGRKLHHLQSDPLRVHCLAFSPDGGTLVAAGHYGHVLKHYSPKTAKAIPLPPGQSSEVLFAARSPATNEIVTVSRHGSAHLYDRAGRHLLRFSGFVAPSCAALSRDGALLAVGERVFVDDAPRHMISVWNLSQRKRIAQLAIAPREGGKVSALIISPDGKAVIAADGSPLVRIWTIHSGKESGCLRHENDVWSLALSPDGKQLATAGWDSTPSLWDLPSMARLPPFAPPGKEQEPHRIETLCFSHDNNFLFSGDDGSQIRAWEIMSRQLCLQFKGNKGAIHSLSCSPKTRILASCDGGHVIRFWDLLAGREIGQLAGHQGMVTSVRFSPDGAHLFSGSGDTTALLWDVRSMAPVVKRPPITLQPQQLHALWEKLANRNARTGREAITQLVYVGPTAVAFLKGKLTPISVEKSDIISRHIADLGSSSFATRTKAYRDLQQWGDLIEPALRSALSKGPPLESKNRLSALLTAIQKQLPSPERLRHRRAIEILESIASNDAHDLLQTIGDGGSGFALTQDARVALTRSGIRAGTR